MRRESCTVLPAMLALPLPALPLLIAGRFSAPPMVFMSAPLAVGLCYFPVWMSRADHCDRRLRGVTSADGGTRAG